MSRRAPAGPTQTDQPAAETERLAAAVVAWRETMLSVKKSVDEATAALELLRTTVREMAPLWRSLDQFDKSVASIDWPEAVAEASAVEESLAKATSLRPQTQPVPEERDAPEPDIPRTEAAEDERAALQPDEPDIRHTEDAAPVFSGRPRPLAQVGLATLDGGAPYSYTVTVEEVGRKVKLVPLHQSLSQVEGVRELWLKSYTNGVAAVCIDSEVELEASALEEAITVGMDKTCRVMSGEGPTFLIRMGESPASGARRQEARPA